MNMARVDTHIVTIAKAPLPGRVKTRLCPPCTPGEAASLARAALLDTLDAAASTPATSHLLALDGPRGDWVPAGWRVCAQRGAGLDERLAAAFADAAGPALLIGMDTPQVTPALLAGAMEQLGSPGVDAVLGPAMDGGYWAIGLRRPAAQVFLGVPMSHPSTAEHQLRRLADLGLRCRLLETLRDVDRMPDAYAVARVAPHSRFARALAEIAPAPPAGP